MNHYFRIYSSSSVSKSLRISKLSLLIKNTNKKSLTFGKKNSKSEDHRMFI